MSEYTQGVMMDGAAILKDGKMLTIDEIVGELRDKEERIKQLEAQIHNMKDDVKSVLFNHTRRSK